MITMQPAKKRSLTGLRATGNLHLGNYLGAMRPALEFCEKYDGIYFIADLHALTSNRNPDLLASQTFDHLATWLAIGLDTEKHTLFRQSDIREHTELSWFLSCVTNLGLLEKSHAFKDAVSQGADVNHGLFAYPVLMAADILLYDADVVPVGKDQKQHVEMARDIAGAFNAIYGDVLKLPEPVIQEEVKLIPGLDGRKMSKSYGNEIALLCPEKELRKKLLSLKTDSTPLEEPKALQGSLVGDLFVLFASAEQFADLEVRLARGGMGWGHAKEELFGVINEHVRPARDRYNELRSDEGYLREVLNRGAEKARAIASPTMSRVRHAVGIR
jgi:tryptophanyl-tRNA synthetase